MRNRDVNRSRWTLMRLSSAMADRGDYPGGFLNTQTGDVIPAALTDELAVGEEFAVDVEDGDWVHLVEDGHEGWQDMAAFATAVRDPRIRGMLDDALKGRGAFSRFRRAIDQADLAAEWHCFADDRRWGRARQSCRTRTPAGVRLHGPDVMKQDIPPTHPQTIAPSRSAFALIRPSTLSAADAGSTWVM